jgi:hypothetical protein
MKKEHRRKCFVQEASRVFDDGHFHRLEGTFLGGVLQKQICL